MSRAGWWALGLVVATLVVVAWYGFGWVSDLEDRVGQTESALSVADARVQRLTRDVVDLGTDLSGLRVELEGVDDNVGEAFSILDGALREMEDQVMILQDQVSDLQTELFFLGFDVSAPAPVFLGDFDQDRWCAEYEVALTDSAVFPTGQSTDRWRLAGLDSGAARRCGLSDELTLGVAD